MATGKTGPKKGWHSIRSMVTWNTFPFPRKRPNFELSGEKGSVCPLNFLDRIDT